MKKTLQLVLGSLALSLLAIPGLGEAVSVPASITIQFSDPAATHGVGADITLPGNMQDFSIDYKQYTSTYKKDDVFNFQKCFFSMTGNPRTFYCTYQSNSTQMLAIVNTHISDSPEAYKQENMKFIGWEVSEDKKWYVCNDWNSCQLPMS